MTNTTDATGKVKEGDRVTRKPINNFSRDGATGTVVEIIGERAKIMWDEKASTGQQHSTIQFKFLTKLP